MGAAHHWFCHRPFVPEMALPRPESISYWDAATLHLESDPSDWSNFLLWAAHLAALLRARFRLWPQTEPGVSLCVAGSGQPFLDKSMVRLWGKWVISWRLHQGDRTSRTDNGNYLMPYSLHCGHSNVYAPARPWQSSNIWTNERGGTHPHPESSWQ